MGLFDGIVGELTGGMGEKQGAHARLLTALMGMLGQSGGLQGLVGMFGQHGLGHVVQSWIGEGNNEPVTPSQVTQVFGQDKIDQLSKSSGLSHQETSSGLASLLPSLVDRLTPDGQAPKDVGGLASGITGLLGGQG